MFVNSKEPTGILLTSCFQSIYKFAWATQVKFIKSTFKPNLVKCFGYISKKIYFKYFMSDCKQHTVLLSYAQLLLGYAQMLSNFSFSSLRYKRT